MRAILIHRKITAYLQIKNFWVRIFGKFLIVRRLISPSKIFNFDCEISRLSKLMAQRGSGINKASLL